MELKPWYSLAKVQQALDAAGEREARAWLQANWSRKFLAADPAVVRLLLAYTNLAYARDRAASVLYAIDHDWAEVLDAAVNAGCGFTAAFWRDAFVRARAAHSVQCLAWLLANEGTAVASLQDDLLEL